jgi:hypothetical protein
MLKLAQEGMGHICRHVAAAGAFADLGGKTPGYGGGQLLCAERFTHVVILPMVGSRLELRSGIAVGLVGVEVGGYFGDVLAGGV